MSWSVIESKAAYRNKVKTDTKKVKKQKLETYNVDKINESTDIIDFIFHAMQYAKALVLAHGKYQELQCVLSSLYLELDNTFEKENRADIIQSLVKNKLSNK